MPAWAIGRASSPNRSAAQLHALGCGLEDIEAIPPLLRRAVGGVEGRGDVEEVQGLLPVADQAHGGLGGDLGHIAQMPVRRLPPRGGEEPQLLAVVGGAGAVQRPGRLLAVAAEGLAHVAPRLEQQLHDGGVPDRGHGVGGEAPRDEGLDHRARPPREAAHGVGLADELVVPRGCGLLGLRSGVATHAAILQPREVLVHLQAAERQGRVGELRHDRRPVVHVADLAQPEALLELGEGELRRAARDLERGARGGQPDGPLARLPALPEGAPGPLRALVRGVLSGLLARRRQGRSELAHLVHAA
mmetsp:Transcript_62788/g.161603  ORF Transcript_62788/g.161603 Transcript_62788/m.161603 type:complete len:302 (+) Transcript_62788:66-971(+)